MNKHIGIISLFFILLSSCCKEDTGTVTIPPLEGYKTAYEAAGKYKLAKIEAEDYPDLHNVFRLSKNIISGSEPIGVMITFSTSTDRPEYLGTACLGWSYKMRERIYISFVARSCGEK